MANIVFILLIISYFDKLYYSYANCTGNCLENFRRKWPKLDFEFYYDHNSKKNSNNSHGFPYSIQNIESTFSTPSIVQSTFTSINPLFQVLMNGSHSPELSAPTLQTNCSDDSSFQELKLLKTSFQNQKSFNYSGENLTEYFRNKLTQAYQYGLNQQNKLSHTESLELKIWSIILDDSKETIEIIYNLRDNGTLMPFEEASKLMTLTPNDLIQNLTGFSIVSKVEPYIVKAPSEKNSIQYNWTNLAFLLIVFGILLLIFLLLALFFYCIFKKERENLMESINREINRVIPTTGSGNYPDDSTNSHWNYATSSADDLSSSSSTNVKKIDKSIQYDYSNLNASASATKSWSTFPTKISSSQHSKERLIPVQSNLPDGYYNNSDYDRISYIHSRETIKETHKHPNILEIKLSEETQSIVKEIRKELDYYNQRKILNDDSSTSEA